MRADLGARSALAVAIALAIVGCTPAPGSTTTSRPATASGGATPATRPSAADRPFTLLTSERPRTFDPALATTDADATVALDVFQRVLSAPTGGGALKPDAGDCLFREPTLYECTLTSGLAFSNTHALTASDVKFSVERLLRLAPNGPTARLFDALAAVEAPDAATVRFRLSWPDTQFGYALAAPAASIVDEEAYPADAARPDTAMPFGSGPFTVSRAASGLTFTRNAGYEGATPAALPSVVLRYAADSAEAEEAMTVGSVDAVWRTLDASALTRLAAGVSVSKLARVALPGVSLERLVWNPRSKARSAVELRTAVAAALQGDRTATSLVPPRVAGSVASFPAGGRPEKAAPPDKVALVLAYDRAAPDAADRANVLRARLQAAGISVTVKPNPRDRDLTLTDVAAPVDTAVAWLEPYLTDPLPGSAEKLVALGQTARAGGEAGARSTALAEIQRQAAVDDTVLPVALGDATLFVSPAYATAPDAFGPSWQLGLWGFTR